MRVHVLVLCDRLDELALTSGDLDAQDLALTGFAVSYLVPALDPVEQARMDALVSRRANLAQVDVDAASWGTVVEQVVSATSADHVLVVTVGDGIYPEALARLADLADRGHDLVVGRRVGQSTWGADASRAPVAVALASRALAGGVASAAAGDSIEEFLTSWHAALLGAASTTTALEDYPVLSPSEDLAEDTVTLTESTAAWDGVELVLEATVASPPADAVAVFAVRGPRGIEHSVPTTVEAGSGGTRLTGRLDVATAALGQPLEDGEWSVGVLVTGSGRSGWASVPRRQLVAGLVGGRPVVPTLKYDDLRLQVGRVRRRYFRVDPTQAVITESVAGVELVIPIQGPHVAQTEAFAGSLFLGGLKIPAVIVSDSRGTTLQAWLSGLGGRYPLSVQFGHVKRVPLDVTLFVDGVGTMTLEPTPPPAQPAAPAPRDNALSRVRRALPDPLVDGLRKVPALRRWYGERVS